MQKNKFNLRLITLSAVLIAMAVVVRFIDEIMIPLGGAGTLRLSLDGIFLSLISVIAGPIIGGMSAGIEDVILCFIKPMGAYIPLLTVTAVVGGAVKGLIYLIMNKVIKNGSKLFTFIKIFVAVIGGGIIVSIANSFILYYSLIAGGETGFIVFMLLRLIKEIVASVIISAVATAVYLPLKKVFGNKI